MATFVIVILLACVIGYAIYHSYQRSKKGSSCCGEHESTIKRIKVADKKRSHYTYHYQLAIGGMTCENCAIKVENAFNQNEGVYARVDIATHQATISLKSDLDEKTMRQFVRDAGYTVLDIHKITI